MSLWFFFRSSGSSQVMAGTSRALLETVFSTLSICVLLLNVRRLALARVIRVSGQEGIAQSSDERVVSDGL